MAFSDGSTARQCQSRCACDSISCSLMLARQLPQPSYHISSRISALTSLSLTHWSHIDLFIWHVSMSRSSTGYSCWNTFPPVIHTFILSLSSDFCGKVIFSKPILITSLLLLSTLLPAFSMPLQSIHHLFRTYILCLPSKLHEIQGFLSVLVTDMSHNRHALNKYILNT